MTNNRKRKPDGGSASFERPDGKSKDPGGTDPTRHDAQAIQDLLAGSKNTPALKSVQSQAFSAVFPLGSPQKLHQALSARGFPAPHAERIVGAALTKAGTALFITFGVLVLVCLIAMIANLAAGAIFFLIGGAVLALALRRVAQSGEWRSRAEAAPRPDSAR